MFMLFNFSLKRSTYYINLGHDITQLVATEHVLQNAVCGVVKFLRLLLKRHGYAEAAPVYRRQAVFNTLPLELYLSSPAQGILKF